MSSGANVSSIDAVQAFRVAMNTFAFEARDALAVYEMEVNRTLDWLQKGAPLAWENEHRKSEAAVAQAKIDLSRCRSMPLADGSAPSCMEEKKQLERARQRLAYVENKIPVVRKAGQAADREVTEYKGRASQLASLLDGEIPRAIALLDRVLTILESYVALNHPDVGAMFENAAGGQTSSVAQPAPAESSFPATPAEKDVPISAASPNPEGATPTIAAHTRDSEQPKTQG
jgi:hypothetical protein